MDETLNTGRPGSMLWISCRICGSRRDAGSEVRKATLNLLAIAALIDGNVDVRNAIDVEPVVFDVFDYAHNRQPGQARICPKRSRWPSGSRSLQ
jgi:hypothetical protein